MLKKSNGKAGDLCDWLDIVVEKTDFGKNGSVSNTSFKAFTICGNANPKDIAYLALAIEFGSPLWTKDKPLATAIQQSRIIELFIPQPY